MTPHPGRAGHGAARWRAAWWRPDPLVAAVLLAMAAQVAAVVLSPLQELLGTSGPPAIVWVLAGAGAVLTGLVARVVGRPRVRPATADDGTTGGPFGPAAAPGRADALSR